MKKPFLRPLLASILIGVMAGTPGSRPSLTRFHTRSESFSTWGLAFCAGPEGVDWTTGGNVDSDDLGETQNDSDEEVVVVSGDVGGDANVASINESPGSLSPDGRVPVFLAFTLSLTPFGVS